MDTKYYSQTKPPILSLEDFEELVDGPALEHILAQAGKLSDMHIANVNSTYYGGGVAEILSSLTLLFNSVGIKTGWRVIQGSPDFFSITKKIHNALQSGEINLSARKKKIYEEVLCENAIRNHLDHDLVLVHDPQPLPLVNYYRRRGPWIWRCHVDLSNPHAATLKYLRQYINEYDAIILSLKEYRQKNFSKPQLFFLPAINPFSNTNKNMDEDEIQERLDHHEIPTDLPLVVQISRFDRWKDPEGVIEVYKKARKEIDCTLVLLGNIATDDPEGSRIYNSLLKCREDRLLIISRQDSALVNALQRKAAVVMQKSIREGFGLTVTEAMWKGAAVIGGNTGGIRYQIKNGDNGYLVSSIDEAAQRLVELLKDEKKRRRMGKKARETVRKNFLLTRLLAQYLDLFNSFKSNFTLRK